MTQVTLQAPEIHCSHCKESIEGAVGALSGVERVSVDIPSATIAVSYDDQAVQLDSIKEAVEDQGYEVTA